MFCENPFELKPYQFYNPRVKYFNKDIIYKATTYNRCKDLYGWRIQTGRKKHGDRSLKNKYTKLDISYQFMPNYTPKKYDTFL